MTGNRVGRPRQHRPFPKKLSVSVTAEMWRRLRDEARRRGIPMGALIAEALDRLTTKA